MSSATPYISLFLTSLVLIAVPGPSILFILGQTLAAGRRNALLSVIGNALGALSVAIVMSIGLSFLLSSGNLLRNLLPLAGALVLAVIGFKYLHLSRSQKAETPIERTAKPSHNACITGFVVGATNPKAYIIFGTIVPGFLPVGLPETSASMLLLLSVIPVLTGLFVDSFWVIAVEKVTSFLDNSSTAIKHMHFLGGLFMIVMALSLVTEATFPT